MKKPVAILGFGRSGTTWVSDIVSKTLGGLVLFEPMFPAILDDALHYSYINPTDAAQVSALKSHFDDVMAGGTRHKWLLRNHLNRKLEEINDDFADQIWDNCAIIGFKEIRANFLLDTISGDWGFNTVFVMRDPRAVIASLKNRPWFWKGDFRGLDNHYRLFSERVLRRPGYRDMFGDTPCPAAVTDSNGVEVEATMWAATHRVVLEKLRAASVPLVFYEDLFCEPFRMAQCLVETLGYAGAHMHPSYIFTPSMVTLRTTHDLDNGQNKIREGLGFFYRDRLNDRDMETIELVLQRFGMDIYAADSMPRRDRLPAGITVVG